MQGKDRKIYCDHCKEEIPLGHEFRRLEDCHFCDEDCEMDWVEDMTELCVAGDE